jgi:hypothetical protein
VLIGHWQSKYNSRGAYIGQYMYTVEITGNNKLHCGKKQVKLDTAKKDVIRQLRKWGIDI